jgi:Protein of unknown function (DUF2934)
MARAKSPLSKANRTSKDQPVSDRPADIPEVNPVIATAPAVTDVKPEVKASSEIPTGPVRPAEIESKPEAKPDSKPETKIFEVRKADARKNVVPINLEDEIRRRAYELYLHREPGSGSQADDWYTAEREILQRYRQHSA